MRSAKPGNHLKAISCINLREKIETESLKVRPIDIYAVASLMSIPKNPPNAF